MKNKKILIMSIIFILYVWLIKTGVNADEYIPIEFTVEKTIISAGESVSIDIKTKGEAIASVDGRLNYDKTKFNEITLSSFNVSSGFSVIYNETTQGFSITSNSINYLIPDDRKIATITFTAKENIDLTDICLQGIVVDGERDYYEMSDNIYVHLEGEKPETDELYLKSGIYKVGEDSQYVDGDEYITKIGSETLISTFLSNIKTNATLKKFYDVDGTELTDIEANKDDLIVKTGMRIVASKDGYSDIDLILIVMGDVNCDGKAKINDLTTIREAILSKGLEPEDITDGEIYMVFDEKQNLAGDLDGDLKITINDLVILREKLLELRDNYFKEIKSN